MRKEFKNAKAKHGLNSKKMGKKANWHNAKHGLITKAKISFGLQNKKGRAQKDRRRGEEKKRIEGKRRRRRREEKKEEGRGVQGKFKGMESNIYYGLLGFSCMDTCFGLWDVRNLTLE